MITKKQIFVPYIGAFGGVERLIISLSSFLHTQAVAHEVVCFQDTIDLARHATWPLEVIALKPKRGSLAEARALSKHLRTSASSDLLCFDLKGAFYASLAHLNGFHLHLTDPPSLLSIESSRNARAYRRWAGERNKSKLRSRVVGEVVHLINRRGVRRAANVIVMTERIAGEIRTLYDVTPAVIRPGVAIWSTPAARGPNSNRRMLSVSRLETSKRIDVAIDALLELRRAQNPSEIENSWTLEIAGAGPSREALEAYAMKRGVAGHVRFLGRITEDELETAYARATVFVMPAVQGYGLPALEALCRHVPVVLHRDSGVSEILRDSPWVEVIENSQALANATSKIFGRLCRNELTIANLPPIPTSDQWAALVAKTCGWIYEAL